MGFLDNLKDKAEEFGDKAKEGFEAAKDKASDVVEDVKDRFDDDETSRTRSRSRRLLARIGRGRLPGGR